MVQPAGENGRLHLCDPPRDNVAGRRERTGSGVPPLQITKGGLLGKVNSTKICADVGDL